ncbi:ABC transporter ATP-binding protein [Acidiferrimicrobium sp. IK]|uniref:ABC transporter ATP-binding protein n=1 Tax=Acidiferrimicrobium sp. IK TaxID=2871700 RepID=UPI0021CAF13C|nr:ABC transporter ATP-binding protein [Acidiferrimicrobium sp. IK]MCU4184952.1 ABC transporter ATP-binding protein [Acidiferrimicrobium sp. IK]
MAALSVRDLSVRAQGLELVRDVSFEVHSGERVALIGESGSGKSLTAMAIVGLLGRGLSASGEARLGDEDLLGVSERRRCQLRGDRIALIFQDPMTALDPTMRIGRQVGEALRQHRGLSRRQAAEAAVKLLARVEIPDPARYAHSYPHQLSGGLRQRVMMAIAISCDPDVILADEPTTALDVTVQRRVLELLDRLVREEGSALLLITHDLAVVSEMCDRVVTMYGGRVVESGSVESMLTAPQHPYTDALLAASSAVSIDGASGEPLPAIAGSVPAAGQFPPGCPYRDRCPRASQQCTTMPPLEAVGDRTVACWHPVGREEPAAGITTEGTLK